MTTFKYLNLIVITPGYALYMAVRVKHQSKIKKGRVVQLLNYFY